MSDEIPLSVYVDSRGRVIWDFEEVKGDHPLLFCLHPDDASLPTRTTAIPIDNILYVELKPGDIAANVPIVCERLSEVDGEQFVVDQRGNRWIWEPARHMTKSAQLPEQGDVLRATLRWCLHSRVGQSASRQEWQLLAKTTNYPWIDDPQHYKRLMLHDDSFVGHTTVVDGEEGD